MHLVLNFPEAKQEVRKTLCGQSTATAPKEAPGGSSNEFVIPTTMSIDEIVKAAAKDDENNICNKCLAEFFDKVLPLKWELGKKEDEVKKEGSTGVAARKMEEEVKEK